MARSRDPRAPKAAPLYPPAERAYFEQGAVPMARALVGAFLVHEVQGDVRVARIVETEAYRGPKDLACHARVGLTKRTRTLLGPHGFAYVFLVYGMHDCFNVVCSGEGDGHAVLVRAGEPVLGIAPGARLDGPGRLARALGIDRSDDGRDLTRPPLYVSPRVGRVKLGTSARVGVGYAGSWADRAWRFFDPASKHVSRPPAASIGRGARKPA